MNNRQLAGDTFAQLKLNGTASLELETFKRREHKLIADARTEGYEIRIIEVYKNKRFNLEYVRIELVAQEMPKFFYGISETVYELGYAVIQDSCLPLVARERLLDELADAGINAELNGYEHYIEISTVDKESPSSAIRRIIDECKAGTQRSKSEIKSEASKYVAQLETLKIPYYVSTLVQSLNVAVRLA